MSTSHLKIVVDHVSDLSSSKKPVLFLSFQFSRPASRSLENPCHKLIAMIFNSPTELTISTSLIHNIASEGETEQELTLVLKSHLPTWTRWRCGECVKIEAPRFAIFADQHGSSGSLRRFRQWSLPEYQQCHNVGPRRRCAHGWSRSGESRRVSQGALTAISVATQGAGRAGAFHSRFSGEQRAPAVPSAAAHVSGLGNRVPAVSRHSTRILLQSPLSQEWHVARLRAYEKTSGQSQSSYWLKQSSRSPVACPSVTRRQWQSLAGVCTAAW